MPESGDDASNASRSHSYATPNQVRAHSRPPRICRGLNSLLESPYVSAWLGFFYLDSPASGVVFGDGRSPIQRVDRHPNADCDAYLHVAIEGVPESLVIRWHMITLICGSQGGGILKIKANKAAQTPCRSDSGQCHHETPQVLPERLCSVYSAGWLIKLSAKRPSGDGGIPAKRLHRGGWATQGVNSGNILDPLRDYPLSALTPRCIISPALPRQPYPLCRGHAIRIDKEGWLCRDPIGDPNDADEVKEYQAWA
ncbi:hypothetical protein FN846DRAFT_893420 [Sphaerosporella brunnea]|uniref:Uncharacterized protein n=1 Tax=Sphaerosporella brunnea TaxID=1250544 RepID=A0A5J5EM01_9PEZI|nr:hypothetical protein FN846DRAFT_893420 [Sphaerosporella brunnea]